MREFSLEGQAFAGAGPLVVPIRFCRQCGQASTSSAPAMARESHHPSAWTPVEDSTKAGYLMLAPLESSTTRIAFRTNGATGTDSSNRLGATACRKRCGSAPNGDFFTMPRYGAVKMWWQAAPFSLCLTVVSSTHAAGRASPKLASLPARPAAVQPRCWPRHCCVIPRRGRPTRQAAQFHRQPPGCSRYRLGISTISSMFRCCAAPCMRVADATELTFDQVADGWSDGMTGLGIREEYWNSIRIAGRPRRMAVFTELTEYRHVRGPAPGLARGSAQPGARGLLRVGYRRLESLCATIPAGSFTCWPAAMPAAERETVIRAVLDQFRRKLAISCPLPFRETAQQQIRRRAEQHLNEFWGLDPRRERSFAQQSVLCGLGQSTTAGGWDSAWASSSKSASFLRQRFGLSTGRLSAIPGRAHGLLLMSGIPCSARPGRRPPVLPT